MSVWSVACNGVRNFMCMEVEYGAPWCTQLPVSDRKTIRRAVGGLFGSLT
jgi:hypothetical protein